MSKTENLAVTDTLNDNPFAVQKKHAVMYISHLPKGFEDSALKSYFSQYGKVMNCKVSRHPQTLKSRHYGWILFEEESVAEIACQSMNNYILGDRVIKCELLRDDQIHDGLFKQYNMRKTKKIRVEDFKKKRVISSSTERKAKKVQKYKDLQLKYNVNLEDSIAALSQ
eukprot:NODE_38_length_30618_cov_0.377142.p16 type:complete len:168 gc:universal NODE_38_length_30618_cov_0.377142:20347-20850(+)